MYIGHPSQQYLYMAPYSIDVHLVLVSCCTTCTFIITWYMYIIVFTWSSLLIRLWIQTFKNILLLYLTIYALGATIDFFFLIVKFQNCFWISTLGNQSLFRHNECLCTQQPRSSVRYAIGRTCRNVLVQVQDLVQLYKSEVTFSHSVSLPLVQVQSGSPSSFPLLSPSPSESALHKSWVHVYGSIQ